jgi:hypothetical protein
MEFIKQDFKEAGWKLTETTPTHYVFNNGESYSNFVISKEPYNKIGVSFPLKTCTHYNYKTTFHDFNEAHEYIQTRLKAY